ncbi:hypothetical protein BJY16_004394 [Actinoplanes octamycinicus]|uniref:DUF1918 domain-containing protein n=1 Tax=Actinoplanes octamycinicus TaxID=135948 RepID=A0A7W7GZ23_9ACTN|nr:DUF1918 domain-containing protein [Actinoplanes octamycinicus]MBB4740935.1 hypothetical protein [Actinoplanes octamycinicus]GIE55842.1 hypothetical protein Aoc01nite_12440 [Actinoplanes octamycinicus]
MIAHEGDRIVVNGRHVGDGDRVGTIVRLHHQDGTPPYEVRWSDGHTGLVFPGPEAHVIPAAAGR